MPPLVVEPDDGANRRWAGLTEREAFLVGLAARAASDERPPIARRPSAATSTAEKATPAAEQAMPAAEGLTERESLLIWASARAACNLTLSRLLSDNFSRLSGNFWCDGGGADAGASRTLTIEVTDITGPKDVLGLSEVSAIDVRNGTAIRGVREQLQVQLQETIDRYRSVTADMVADVGRPIVTVLGIYEAHAKMATMLLDSATRYSSELAASVAIRSQATSKSS
jgi:hypothetical protein